MNYDPVSNTVADLTVDVLSQDQTWVTLGGGRNLHVRSTEGSVLCGRTGFCWPAAGDLTNLPRCSQCEKRAGKPDLKPTCVCGKQITLRADGTFRRHSGHEHEWPGSPWKKICRGSGATP